MTPLIARAYARVGLNLDSLRRERKRQRLFWRRIVIGEPAIIDQLIVPVGFGPIVRRMLARRPRPVSIQVDAKRSITSVLFVLRPTRLFGCAWSFYYANTGSAYPWLALTFLYGTMMAPRSELRRELEIWAGGDGARVTDKDGGSLMVSLAWPDPARAVCVPIGVPHR